MKIYNFLLAGLFAANNDVRCPVEKALRLDCQTNSFDLELTDAIEENQACQEIRPDLHRLTIVNDDTEETCPFWDGYDFNDTFNYNSTCLQMENGAINGKIHHYQLINDTEYEVDQPISFSCSPDTIELSSRNFTMDDFDSNASHLHKKIKAPNGEITIYDYLTNEEAEKIVRGQHYSAIITLGDILYEEYEMIVDICQVGDEFAHVTTVIENNEISSNVEGVVTSAESVSNSDFEFDFKGFTLKGSKKIHITCKVSIVAKVELTPTTNMPPPSEPSTTNMPPPNENLKTHGTNCTTQDECLSGVCHFKALFHPDSHADFDQKVCLEDPTEWHACETTSDCDSVANPFQDDEHWLKDYFSYIFNQEQIEAKSRAYPEPTVQLVCAPANMLINSPDYKYKDFEDYEDDYIRSMFLDRINELFQDVTSAGLNHNICYVPLDMYRAARILRIQFIPCTDNNHCMSKECNLTTGICLRPELEDCSTDDQCLSGNCVHVNDNLGNVCQPIAA